MSASEFLRQLDMLLMQLPAAERESAFTYYRDYFADAGEENEQAVINELGSPEKIASEIISDYYAKNGMAPPAAPPTKRGMPLAVKIILWIFLGPVGLGLLIAFLAILFAVLLIPSIFLLVGGIYSIGSFVVIFFHAATGLLALGLGIFCMGLGLLLFVPLWTFVKAGWRWMVQLIKKLIGRGESMYD